MNKATESTGVSPVGVDLGRWVYSAWKHLRSFDQRIVASFEATSIAGKACDLLGRMRWLAPYGPLALRPLYFDAGITRPEFNNTLLPLLETLGIFQVSRHPSNRIHSIQALVLSQADVMDQTARCWKQLDPEPMERGALELLRRTADLPLTREEAIVLLMKSGLDLDEEDAVEAIELALSVDLVHLRDVPDLEAQFLYNDFLWGEHIDRTSRALAALPSGRRTALRSLLEELHRHEGRPTPEIQSAAPDIVDQAIAQGLIEATEINTSDGYKATFHFTPRFRGYGVSQGEIPDALDQVKLVIASFAFSTRYAEFKLRDPERFLDSLISRGYAGDASPIGTDYGEMEKQKIVNVEPTQPGSSRYRFIAVKRDTLIEARDTMRAGALLLPTPHSSGTGLLSEPYGFTDPVKTRQHARSAADRPLYDAKLLAAFREAAQQEGF
jgi:hypothetical protein